ncbi:MAG: hypothetical protein HY211_01445 [Candidatus Omnitrophica bacterium]|nr:hypothetical protein [Candidatus Omnitrophota bacterium]
MNMRWRQSKVFFGLALLVALGFCQDGWAEETVSAREFQKLKEEHEQLKREVQQLREVVARRREVAPAVAPEKEPVSPEEFGQLKEKVDALSPGLTKFLLAGYAAAGYTDPQRAKTNSNFTANFNPIFLWEPTDRLLFEGELELELEDGKTETSLEYADVSYLLNDYMTLEGGKFLSPFGIFMERLHPAWINKLTDKPLGYKSGSTRLVPESEIGAQVRGAVPLPLFELAKANYALWISNGPTVQTSATHAGELAFANTEDNNNNKAVGLRVGFSPIPEAEVGYSLLRAQVGGRADADPGVHATLQGLDFSYTRDSELLKGIIDLRSEWIWSHVGAFNYGTGKGAFSNDRRAGYLQGAYRPKVGGKLIERLEPVVRFDIINQPSDAPSSQDETRWTLGLNYHLTPSAVFKTAYRLDKRKGTQDEDAFLTQVAMGF